MPIGVGLVGVNPEQGWAMRAHIPAIAASPEFRLAAVCNHHADVAERARIAAGANHAFSDAEQLALCADVDLVVVCVKVPEHGAVVRAALKAGKHVYCEWPLAGSWGEARELSQLAAHQHVLTFAGLQARSSPALRWVRRLVQSGDLGEVLSTTLVGSGRGWGATTTGRLAYTYDAAYGASMLTIAFGHAVDALCWTLGDFESLSATAAKRRKTIRVDGQETIENSVYDQVAVTGTLSSGAVASVHYRGGTSAATNFLWEINCERGDVLVTAPTGQLQLSRPRVQVSLRRGPLSDVDGLDPDLDASDERHNLVEAYANLGRVLSKRGADSAILATFAEAAQRHALLETVELAAVRGERVDVPNHLASNNERNSACERL